MLAETFRGVPSSRIGASRAAVRAPVCRTSVGVTRAAPIDPHVLRIGCLLQKLLPQHRVQDAFARISIQIPQSLYLRYRQGQAWKIEVLGADYVRPLPAICASDHRDRRLTFENRDGHGATSQLASAKKAFLPQPTGRGCERSCR